MRPASELKQDLDVSRSLGDIIDVLKTAAMIQFRAAQSKERPNQGFLHEIEVCFSMLPTKTFRHPYLFDRPSLPSALLVVTSDEGFLGELNTLLVNAMLDQRKSKEDQIIVMGERGARYLEDMEEKFVLFPGVSDEIAYSQTEKIRDYLINGYRKKFGRVFVIYPQFVSVTLQRVVVYQLFPYTIAQAQTSLILEELLIEPSFHRVVEGMIELWAGYKLLELFWSSKQSEFAARIMHLEGSTQELAHLKQKLSLEYFRQVHTIRDKIIREITGSKIMLDKKRRMLKPVSNN